MWQNLPRYRWVESAIGNEDLGEINVAYVDYNMYIAAVENAVHACVVNHCVLGELIAPVARLVTWEPSDGLLGSSNLPANHFVSADPTHMLQRVRTAVYSSSSSSALCTSEVCTSAPAARRHAGLPNTTQDNTPHGPIFKAPLLNIEEDE